MDDYHVVLNYCYTNINFYNEDTPNFQTAFRQLLSFTGCFDGYFYYKNQKILMSTLGFDYFDNAIYPFDQFLTGCIQIFLVRDTAPYKGQSLYKIPQLQQQDVYFLPFNWTTTDEIYNDCAGLVQDFDGDWQRIFSVGDTPITFLNERDNNDFIYSNIQPLVGYFKSTSAILPFKTKSNNQVFTPNINQTYWVANQNFDSFLIYMVKQDTLFIEYNTDCNSLVAKIALDVGLNIIPLNVFMTGWATRYNNQFSFLRTIQGGGSISSGPTLPVAKNQTPTDITSNPKYAGQYPYSTLSTFVFGDLSINSAGGLSYTPGNPNIPQIYGFYQQPVSGLGFVLIWPLTSPSDTIIFSYGMNDDVNLVYNAGTIHAYDSSSLLLNNPLLPQTYFLSAYSNIETYFTCTLYSLSTITDSDTQINYGYGYSNTDPYVTDPSIGPFNYFTTWTTFDGGSSTLTGCTSNTTGIGYLVYGLDYNPIISSQSPISDPSYFGSTLQNHFTLTGTSSTQYQFTVYRIMQSGPILGDPISLDFYDYQVFGGFQVSYNKINGNNIGYPLRLVVVISNLDGSGGLSLSTITSGEITLTIDQTFTQYFSDPGYYNASNCIEEYGINPGIDACYGLGNTFNLVPIEYGYLRSAAFGSTFSPWFLLYSQNWLQTGQVNYYWSYRGSTRESGTNGWLPTYPDITEIGISSMIPEGTIVQIPSGYVANLFCIQITNSTFDIQLTDIANLQFMSFNGFTSTNVTWTQFTPTNEYYGISDGTFIDTNGNVIPSGTLAKNIYDTLPTPIGQQHYGFQNLDLFDPYATNPTQVWFNTFNIYNQDVSSWLFSDSTQSNWMQNLMNTYGYQFNLFDAGIQPNFRYMSATSPYPQSGNLVYIENNVQNLANFIYLGGGSIYSDPNRTFNWLQPVTTVSDTGSTVTVTYSGTINAIIFGLDENVAIGRDYTNYGSNIMADIGILFGSNAYTITFYQLDNSENTQFVYGQDGPYYNKTVYTSNTAIQYLYPQLTRPVFIIKKTSGASFTSINEFNTSGAVILINSFPKQLYTQQNVLLAYNPSLTDYQTCEFPLSEMSSCPNQPSGLTINNKNSINCMVAVNNVNGSTPLINLYAYVTSNTYMTSQLITYYWRLKACTGFTPAAINIYGLQTVNMQGGRGNSITTTTPFPSDSLIWIYDNTQMTQYNNLITISFGSYSINPYYYFGFEQSYFTKAGYLNLYSPTSSSSFTSTLNVYHTNYNAKNQYAVLGYNPATNTTNIQDNYIDIGPNNYVITCYSSFTVNTGTQQVSLTTPSTSYPATGFLVFGTDMNTINSTTQGIYSDPAYFGSNLFVNMQCGAYIDNLIIVNVFWLNSQTTPPIVGSPTLTYYKYKQFIGESVNIAEYVAVPTRLLIVLAPLSGIISTLSAFSLANQFNFSWDLGYTTFFKNASYLGSSSGLLEYYDINPGIDSCIGLGNTFNLVPLFDGYLRSGAIGKTPIIPATFVLRSKSFASTGVVNYYWSYRGSTRESGTNSWLATYPTIGSGTSAMIPENEIVTIPTLNASNLFCVQITNSTFNITLAEILYDVDFIMFDGSSTTTINFGEFSPTNQYKGISDGTAIDDNGNNITNGSLIANTYTGLSLIGQQHYGFRRYKIYYNDSTPNYPVIWWLDISSVQAREQSCLIIEDSAFNVLATINLGTVSGPIFSNWDLALSQTTFSYISLTSPLPNSTSLPLTQTLRTTNESGSGDPTGWCLMGAGRGYYNSGDGKGPSNLIWLQNAGPPIDDGISTLTISTGSTCCWYGLDIIGGTIAIDYTQYCSNMMFNIYGQLNLDASALQLTCYFIDYTDPTQYIQNCVCYPGNTVKYYNKMVLFGSTINECFTFDRLTRVIINVSAYPSGSAIPIAAFVPGSAYFNLNTFPKQLYTNSNKFNSTSTFTDFARLSNGFYNLSCTNNPSGITNNTTTTFASWWDIDSQSASWRSNLSFYVTSNSYKQTGIKRYIFRILTWLTSSIYDIYPSAATTCTISSNWIQEGTFYNCSTQDAGNVIFFFVEVSTMDKNHFNNSAEIYNDVQIFTYFGTTVTPIPMTQFSGYLNLGNPVDGLKSANVAVATNYEIVIPPTTTPTPVPTFTYDPVNPGSSCNPSSWFYPEGSWQSIAITNPLYLTFEVTSGNNQLFDNSAILNDLQFWLFTSNGQQTQAFSQFSSLNIGNSFDGQYSSPGVLATPGSAISIPATIPLPNTQPYTTIVTSNPQKPAAYRTSWIRLDQAYNNSLFVARIFISDATGTLWTIWGDNINLPIEVPTLNLGQLIALRLEMRAGVTTLDFTQPPTFYAPYNPPDFEPSAMLSKRVKYHQDVMSFSLRASTPIINFLAYITTGVFPQWCLLSFGNSLAAVTQNTVDAIFTAKLPIAGIPQIFGTTTDLNTLPANSLSSILYFYYEYAASQNPNNINNIFVNPNYATMTSNSNNYSYYLAAGGFNSASNFNWTMWQQCNNDVGLIGYHPPGSSPSTVINTTDDVIWNNYIDNIQSYYAGNPLITTYDITQPMTVGVRILKKHFDFNSYLNFKNDIQNMLICTNLNWTEYDNTTYSPRLFQSQIYTWPKYLPQYQEVGVFIPFYNGNETLQWNNNASCMLFSENLLPLSRNTPRCLFLGNAKYKSIVWQPLFQNNSSFSFLCDCVPTYVCICLR